MIFEYRIVYSDEDVESIKREFLKKGIVLSRLRLISYGQYLQYLPSSPVRTEMEITYCHAAAKFQHLMVL